MFRGLRADEIELRVGTVAKTKTGFSLLCYKDARCDQNILDEVYGAEYWQRDHKEVKGNLYCGVGIYNKDISEWVWKWDCGTESQAEAQKGEASDSFKRACFNLGIGRELYTSPFIWIDDHMDNDKPDAKFVAGLRISDIEYEETETKRVIKKLVIKDKHGVVVYPKGYTKAEPKAEPPKAEPQFTKNELITKITALAEVKGIAVEEVCSMAKVTSLNSLTKDRLTKCLEWIEKRG